MKISFNLSCDECTCILKLKGVQRCAHAQHRYTQLRESIKLLLLLVAMTPLPTCLHGSLPGSLYVRDGACAS